MQKGIKAEFTVEDLPRVQTVFLHHGNGTYALSYEEAREFAYRCRDILQTDVNVKEFDIYTDKFISKRIKPETLVVARENIYQTWVALKRVFHDIM